MLLADFNKTLPKHPMYCPSNRSKSIRVFVAFFSLYECFISTLYAIVQVQYGKTQSRELCNKNWNLSFLILFHTYSYIEHFNNLNFLFST